MEDSKVKKEEFFGVYAAKYCRKTLRWSYPAVCLTGRRNKTPRVGQFKVKFEISGPDFFDMAL
jgi:hypothetical protein